MSEKRLLQIKEDTYPKLSINPLPKGKELVIYEKDFNWLIEQADRIIELEKENKQYFNFINKLAEDDSLTYRQIIDLAIEILYMGGN